MEQGKALHMELHMELHTDMGQHMALLLGKLRQLYMGMDVPNRTDTAVLLGNHNRMKIFAFDNPNCIRNHKLQMIEPRLIMQL